MLGRAAGSKPQKPALTKPHARPCMHPTPGTSLCGPSVPAGAVHAAGGKHQEAPPPDICSAQAAQGVVQVLRSTSIVQAVPPHVSPTLDKACSAHLLLVFAQKPSSPSHTCSMHKRHGRSWRRCKASLITTASPVRCCYCWVPPRCGRVRSTAYSCQRTAEVAMEGMQVCMCVCACVYAFTDSIRGMPIDCWWAACATLVPCCAQPRCNTCAWLHGALCRCRRRCTTAGVLSSRAQAAALISHEPQQHRRVGRPAGWVGMACG